jgi:hypothetical protein
MIDGIWKLIELEEDLKKGLSIADKVKALGVTGKKTGH